MFCSNCGAQVNDQKRFCSNCGAPVSKPSNTQPETPLAPPAAPSEPLRQEPVKKDKYSRIGRKRVIVSGIMGILFGCFGVHNFIMEQPVRGILHNLLFFLPILPVLLLFVDILSSGFINNLGINYVPTDETVWMLPMTISWLWGLIDGIILLATSSKYHYGKK